jgi:YcxB-like protein
MPPISVQYTMTADDLVDGQRLAQRPFRRLVAGLGAVLCISGLGLILTGSAGLGAGLILLGSVDLAILAAGRPLERFGMRRRASPLIGSECEVSLTDGAVLFRNGGTKGQIPWSDLTGIAEDPHTLALASHGVLRLGIPKRAFDSDTALDAFRREAIARISVAQAGGGPP